MLPLKDLRGTDIQSFLYDDIKQLSSQSNVWIVNICTNFVSFSTSECAFLFLWVLTPLQQVALAVDSWTFCLDSSFSFSLFLTFSVLSFGLWSLSVFHPHLFDLGLNPPGYQAGVSSVIVSLSCFLQRLLLMRNCSTHTQNDISLSLPLICAVCLSSCQACVIEMVLMS